ncbi:hypothetical protein MKL26_02700 [Streptococcus suis]|nr:hypothetical protein [Streptococcus suis]
MTKSLKPTQAAIKSTYEDFPELKELLENSEYVKDGYFIVNNHKWFTEGFPHFLKFKINHSSKTGIYLKRIEVKLSRSTVDDRSEKENEAIDSRWKNHPKDILGKGVSTKYFQEGHLLAKSLVKYVEDFKHKKWENFVMITEWCNCAEASSYSGKGMKYFERIVLDSLEAGRDIYYRVSPIFKKKPDSNGYEILPRGIMLTANITNGKNKKFVGYEGAQFNVFIPNAQEDLIISYKDGNIYKRILIGCKGNYRKKRKRKRVFQIRKGR